MRNYAMAGNREKPCGCGSDVPFLNSEYVVGMAYVPWQNMGTTYELDKALEVGTIFPELDKPFLAAGRGNRR